MPHTRSAKKNLRKSEKHRLHNRAAKKAIKTQVKELLALAKDAPVDKLKEAYNVAAKRLDKAAARHIIHGNLAARKKSQLAKLVHRRSTAAKA